MYLQITNKCNMKCRHCGFACTDQGEDMSLDIFREAIKTSNDDGGTLVLGGGEPTIHPLFWQFLGEAMASAPYGVWLATNGKIKEIAIPLANLAKRGVIGCDLSQDRWHSKIDPAVVEAFTRQPGDKDRFPEDRRAIRNVGKDWNGNARKPVKAGRCKSGREDCICEGLIVKPNGDIYLCGCADSIKLGDVFTGYNPPMDTEREHVDCVRDLRKSGRALEVAA